MSIFLRENPFIESGRSLLHNSIFDDDSDDGDYKFLHSLIPDKHAIRHPRRLLYLRNHHRNGGPYKTLKKQLTKALKRNSEVFHLVDFSPKINISEDNENYYLHADLPGMTKDQVKMEITEDNIFTLSGERKSVRKEGNFDKDNVKKEEELKEKDNKTKKNNKKSKKEKSKSKNNELKDKDQKIETTKEKNENKKEKFSLMECSYGKFKRSFTLPEDVNLDHIDAKMMNGVLKVTFKKITPTKKDQTRTIEIH